MGEVCLDSYCAKKFVGSLISLNVRLFTLWAHFVGEALRLDRLALRSDTKWCLGWREFGGPRKRLSRGKPSPTAGWVGEALCLDRWVLRLRRIAGVL